MEDFKLGLGDEVQDKVTGFTGIVRGRTQYYLTGCNTYGIQNTKLGKDGNPREWKWFDEDQLKLKKSKKITLTNSTEATKRGGPNSKDQYSHCKS